MEQLVMDVCPKCKNPIPQDAPDAICLNCLLSDTIEAAESPALSDPSTGKPTIQIDGFRILGEIARGGMGIVYKAYQENLGRVVAIKILRDGHFADSHERERFRLEAESAARLRHPGIVHIHQVGVVDKTPYFSMDLVEGGSLDTRITNGPLSEREAAQIIKNVAESIAYAHSEGIIHRDLKPQNILTDNHGRLQITDFGIAKRVDDDTDLTLTGSILGSPFYMSPEQAAGKTREIGAQSDIYALGSILYFLITGRPPFQAASTLQTLHQVIHQEPVEPKTLNPEISTDLNTICLKLLEKTPNSRYPTAQAVADELGRFLDGKPIAARPITIRERGAKWIRRNPTVSKLLATIGLLTIAGFLAGAWQLNQTQNALTETERLRRAEINARASRLEPIFTFRHEGEIHGVTFTPNGQDLLSVSTDGSWRRHRPETGELVAEQEAHNGVIADATYSHDGKRFLTYSYDSQTHFPHITPEGEKRLSYTSHAYGDQSAKVWDAETGACLLTITNSVQVTSATWSPKDKRIALANWDGVVTLYNSADGTEIGSRNLGPGAIRSLDFSPDAQRLVASRDGTIYQMQMTPNTRGGSSSTDSNPTIATVLSGADASIVYEIKRQDRSGPTLLGFLDGPNSCRSLARFNPNGQTLVTVGEAPENCALWDASTGKRIANLKNIAFSVVHTAFSSEGHWLATACADGTAKIWNAQTGKEIHTLKAHKGPILWVEFSPDSKWIVTASADGAARVWSLDDGTCVSLLQGHTHRVYQARFSPDSLRIATASLDGTARVWKTAAPETLSTRIETDGKILGLQFSPNGKTVTTWTNKGTTTVSDIETATQTRSFLGLPELRNQDLRDQFLDETSKVEYAPGSTRIAILTEESRYEVISGGNARRAPHYSPLRVWDIPTGNLLQTFPREDLPIATFSISPDGTKIAAGQDVALHLKTIQKSLFKYGSFGNQRRFPSENQAWIWDIATGEPLVELPAIHEGPVSLVAFTPDSQRLVTSDQVATRVWDINAPSSPVELESSAFGREVFFRPNRNEAILRTAAWIGIWNLETGEKLRPLPEEPFPLNENEPTCYSAANDYLAFAYHREHIMVLNVNTGDLIADIHAQETKVNAIAFSPDGALLSVAGDDKLVHVWDLPSGARRATLRGHDQPVTDVQFSPDGQWLGSTSKDYSLRIWPVLAF